MSDRWPKHPDFGRSVCAGCGGEVTTEWGYDRPYCTRCVPCDECGHANAVHRSPRDTSDLDWGATTCWGESVCRECIEARDLCQRSFMAGQHCILPVGHDGGHA